MDKRHNFLFFPLIALLTLGLVVTGCDDDDDVTCPSGDNGDPAGLVVSPDSLYIDDNDPTGIIYLSTFPPGDLTWRISAAPVWLSTNPDSGSVGRGMVETIVSCDAENLSPGMHRGRIEMISTGGDADVEVFFSVGVHPLASVSDTILNFDTGFDELTLDIINVGTGMVQWTLEESSEWLAISSDNGIIYPEQSYPVMVQVNRAGMEAGDYTTTMTLVSNSELGDISILVNLEVAAESVLNLSGHSLVFDYFEDSESIAVFNTGNIGLDWSVTPDQVFVSFDVESGNIAPGDSSFVMVSVDRTGLATGVHEADLTFSTTDLQEMTTHLTVNHFNDESIALENRVIDAEYDRNQDLIVTVSDSPAQLNILDPESGESTSIALSLTPTCVSIRPDGAYAAVGHNAYFSLVDLTLGTVEQTYAATTDALDIILAGNGFCYVLPRRDQWENMRCIDLATGVETLSTGRSLYAGTLAKLHPSGDYIYGANNGLSPSDFEKYDIRGGTAVYLYDSPYHGDYAFSGNIWISDDGLRLFARSSNVFRSSTNQADDMTYNGNLAGLSGIVWLDHSSAAGLVLAVGGGGYFDPPNSDIFVYNNEFLALQGTFPLPQFLVPDGTGGGNLYNAEGHFVFMNNAGDRFYALIKAANESGLMADWALFSGDISDLP